MLKGKDKKNTVLRNMPYCSDSLIVCIKCEKISNFMESKYLELVYDFHIKFIFQLNIFCMSAMEQ